MFQYHSPRCDGVCQKLGLHRISIPMSPMQSRSVWTPAGAISDHFGVESALFSDNLASWCVANNALLIYSSIVVNVEFVN